MNVYSVPMVWWKYAGLSDKDMDLDDFYFASHEDFSPIKIILQHTLLVYVWCVCRGITLWYMGHFKNWKLSSQGVGFMHCYYDILFELIQQRCEYTNFFFFFVFIFINTISFYQLCELLLSSGGPLYGKRYKYIRGNFNRLLFLLNCAQFIRCFFFLLVRTENVGYGSALNALDINLKVRFMCPAFRTDRTQYME